MPIEDYLRQLAAEGLSRHDLPRQDFIDRVWAWKNESGGAISRQMRRFGDSANSPVPFPPFGACLG